MLYLNNAEVLRKLVQTWIPFQDKMDGEEKKMLNLIV